MSDGNRRRIWPALWRFASVMAVGLLLMVAVMLTSANDRSFLIEAETFGAELTFQGDANAWHFGDATLCQPRPVPQPRLASGENGDAMACSPALFEISQLQDHAINWRSGTTIKLVTDTTGALSLQLVGNGQDELPSGAFVVIPAQVWASHGAFTFSGTMRIGDVIASGARNYLHSGRWEVRQGGFATSIFRDVVEVVKRGEFTLGASVEIYDGDRQATLFGSITPSDEAIHGNGRGMHLVALSEKGPIELQLDYFGLRSPTILQPDWIDRITSSSTLVALIALMTFIVNGYQIFLFSRISESVSGLGAQSVTESKTSTRSDYDRPADDPAPETTRSSIIS